MRHLRILREEDPPPESRTILESLDQAPAQAPRAGRFLWHASVYRAEVPTLAYEPEARSTDR